MQRILLASHGTVGARAAEQAVLTRLNAGDELIHLMVVPEFWDGMPAEEGSPNTGSSEVFGEYVEDLMEQQARDTFARVGEIARQRGIVYESRLVYGKPAYVMLEAVADISPDYVITGSPRPKHQDGLHSKMITESLLRSMVIPLLIIPYPDERC